METRRLLRLLALAAMAAVVSGCSGLPVGSRSSSEPRAVISQVSGNLEVTNSRSGQALFQASGLAPGGSATGTVQLSNTGSLTGDLNLAQVDMQDLPGANGGRLSDAVQLDVLDVTGGSSVPVFSGQLGVLGSRPLGSITPGEVRTYRFTASLPDTGAPAGPTVGDNAYLGSGVTVRYAWTATAPDGTGTGGGDTGGGGNTGETPADPATFSFQVAAKQLLKRGWLDVLVRCERSCELEAWATLVKVSGARAGHRYATLPLPGKTGRIRLKMSKKGMRAVHRALRTRRRIVLRVHLHVVPTAGTSRTYSKKIVVKRPAPKRRR